jgi:hypothetical protein
MLVIGLLGSEIAMTYAVEPQAEKIVSPTINERLTKDTIKGTLMRKEAEYYFIQEDNNGGVQRIHVDKSTKLDKVMPGDMIKAYVTENGHATTVERAK